MSCNFFFKVLTGHGWKQCSLVDNILSIVLAVLNASFIYQNGRKLTPCITVHPSRPP